VSNDPYAAPTANLENFTDAPVIPTKTLSAKGRLTVRSFMAQTLVLFVVVMAIFAVLAVVATAVTGISVESLTSPESIPQAIDFSNPALIALAVVAGLVYLGLIVISIIMSIKRIHDRNHSGWWILALYIGLIIPYVNIVAIVGFLYVMFWPGQKTGNRFGGPRPTKGWENALGILYIVLIVGSIVAALALGGSAIVSGLI